VTNQLGITSPKCLARGCPYRLVLNYSPCVTGNGASCCRVVQVQNLLDRTTHRCSYPFLNPPPPQPSWLPIPACEGTYVLQNFPRPMRKLDSGLFLIPQIPHHTRASLCHAYHSLSQGNAAYIGTEPTALPCCFGLFIQRLQSGFNGPGPSRVHSTLLLRPRSNGPFHRLSLTY
jgi:hypothetical protein